ncbi:MAG TPA: hypothetical protein DCO79_15775 [Spirochaeta sp.]|nr:hypothetical protein [Spirochaeta sp.]
MYGPEVKKKADSPLRGTRRQALLLLFQGKPVSLRFGVAKKEKKAEKIKTVPVFHSDFIIAVGWI